MATENPNKPEIGQHRTHPNAYKPKPDERVVTFDDPLRDDVTVAYRTDISGTYKSLREADVAVFIFEEPQKQFILEYLWILENTNKPLFVVLGNKLLYGTRYPYKQPWEDGNEDSRSVTPWDIRRVPAIIKPFIERVFEKRTPFTAGMAVARDYVEPEDIDLEVLDE